MAKGKKRRRRAQGERKQGGALMGMRSGFKKVASKVTGPGDKAAAKKPKSSWVSNAITVILLIAAAAMLIRRFR